MFYGTNPETVSRWAVADAGKPGTAEFRQGQAGLRSWIDSQIQQAIQTGQLDPNDRAGMQSFLATLGVTNQKGGGMFLFNEIMNRGGMNKYAGMQAGPQAGPRASQGQTFGAPAPPTIGGLMGMGRGGAMPGDGMAGGMPDGMDFGFGDETGEFL